MWRIGLSMVDRAWKTALMGFIMLQMYVSRVRISVKSAVKASVLNVVLDLFMVQFALMTVLGIVKMGIAMIAWITVSNARIAPTAKSAKKTSSYTKESV